MRDRRGEAEYDLKIDKEACPECGAERSYDEVVTKKVRCPGCGLRYAKPKSFVSRYLKTPAASRQGLTPRC